MSPSLLFVCETAPSKFTRRFWAHSGTINYTEVLPSTQTRFYLLHTETVKQMHVTVRA